LWEITARVQRAESGRGATEVGWSNGLLASSWHQCGCEANWPVRHEALLPRHQGVLNRIRHLRIEFWAGRRYNKMMRRKSVCVGHRRLMDRCAVCSKDNRLLYALFSTFLAVACHGDTPRRSPC
jgi:hypothetical protein